ncbi:MAG: uracil-DNA glycosylase [Actinomycetota bacterium]|nr:uracil-DNA glycosylase [Actinomycetota bacterium]
MEELSKLAESSIGCTLCPLAEQGRTQVVFGHGNPHADILFIGEGPGSNEDKQGVPFVGAAGKLLTQLLETIGLERKDVYITNVVKCRPPGNRDPKPDEIEICTNRYLFSQMDLIGPKVIATLGRFASSVILEMKNVSMGSIHGRKFIKGTHLVVPIYHPAAALHSRANMKPLTEDFENLRLYVEEKAAEEQGCLDEKAQVETQIILDVEAEQMGLF